MKIVAMNTEFADSYVRLENDHWWFRARRIILKTLLAQDITWERGMQVLEVGCGPGGNLREVYPDFVDLTGVEPDIKNAQNAARHSRAHVHVGGIGDLPLQVKGKLFDVVCLFDVLEHIENDADALSEIKALMVPDGVLVLTVPAFMWLWGKQDVVSRHYRRYTMRGLVNLLESHGLVVKRSTYFNTFIFPAIATVRLLARRCACFRNGAASDFDVNPAWARSVLYRIFVAEAYLLPHLSFPFGVSLYAVSTLHKKG